MRRDWPTILMGACCLSCSPGATRGESETAASTASPAEATTASTEPEAGPSEALSAEQEQAVASLVAALDRNFDDVEVQPTMELLEQTAASGALVGVPLAALERSLGRTEPGDPPRAGSCSSSDSNVCQGQSEATWFFPIGRRERSLGIVPTLLVEVDSEGFVTRASASFPR